MSFYGASLLLAQRCGFAGPLPFSGLRWQHGWCARQAQSIDPILVVQEHSIERDLCYLVARKEQADYLKSLRIDALAVGLPFVYADTPELPRIKNSLLVMPAHSLEYTTHDWKFEEYANSIAEIRHDFETVVACIHPSCIENNYWVPQFKKLGIPCVTGAGARDANGILRVKMLLEQFDAMTTNALGSHVAYAAASEVKVSVFGEYTRFQVADYERAEFYQQHPHLLEPNIHLWSEEFAKENYPWLFCHPSKAIKQVNWGREQIGWCNRLHPAAIKKLMGWDRATRFRRNAKAVCRQVSRKPERWAKSIFRKAS